MSDSRENGSGLVALTIPARAEYVALCRLALTGLARTRELEPEVVADLKLALTEACSNSVRHAYEEGRDGLVQISYHLDGDRIAVEVADDGAGFDPEVLRRAEEELDEGGLGIAIIRAVTDELDIGPNPAGAGSRLRFTKYLN
ncbi:MAG TPA: ATP-binding protein [Gaiellaceae bacterium]|nr:ATP-binding protein [Gaiellaceae bacterium]